MGLIQYEEAEQSFLKALQQSNGLIEAMDYDINYYLATAYYKQGETDKALQAYDAISRNGHVKLQIVANL